ncbi:hypothetical protein HMPREF2533_01068, partial [Bacteroides fragilis]
MVLTAEDVASFTTEPHRVPQNLPKPDVSHTKNGSSSNLVV